MAHRSIFRLTALALGLLTLACAPAPEPQPEPTLVQIDIAAAPDANPDPTGRASPVRVFVYALKEGAQFAIADPDTLLGGEMGALGQSMTRKADFVLRAGKTSKKRFELPDGFTAVGVAVGYRQFDTAEWRASAPVTPNAVTLLNAAVGANAVRLTN